MLKCHNCAKESLWQCNTCSSLKLCLQCYENHRNEHEKEKTKYSFEPVNILISNEHLEEIRKKVQENIKAIIKQKKAIIKVAKEHTNQFNEIVKNSIDLLSKMIKEYEILTMKKSLDIDEFKRVENFLKEKLVFVYPCFSKLLGNLTENSKVLITNPTKTTKKALISDYNLYIEGHTSGVSCLAATKDIQFIISGSWDTSIRIWSLQEKR